MSPSSHPREPLDGLGFDPRAQTPRRPLLGALWEQRRASIESRRSSRAASLDGAAEAVAAAAFTAWIAEVAIHRSMSHGAEGEWPV